MKILRLLLSIFLGFGFAAASTAAVTIGTAKGKQRVVQGSRSLFVDIVGPASYLTGGEILTAAQLNELMPEYGGNLGAVAADFAKIEFFESEFDTAARYIIYDRATGKLMYWQGNTQIANATNLSAVTLRCRIEYQIAPTG
jgi:hypothetical protein